tara:strand:+ start:3001 stop:3750 length:750 start_codon:yes stop_codon:yes gene_type:complete
MIVAEIGLNHMGDYETAKEYVNFLIDTEVDAITFQIREQSFYLKSKKSNLNLNKKVYIEMSKKAAKFQKKFGLALSDMSLIDEVDEYMDFYKILSKDFSYNFIDHFLRKTDKPLYISTGLNSIESITSVLEKLTDKDKSRISLIHTQLSNDVESVNLKSLKFLQKLSCGSVAFGNHCEDYRVCFMSLCYNPSAVFVYVKKDNQIEYPDNKHAIMLENFGIFCKDIKKLNNAIGSGIKVKMKNTIRGQNE